MCTGIRMLNMRMIGVRRIRTKGISPLVASVLLIAATMSIAGILAYWASSYVRSSLPEQTNTTDAQCAGSNFDIYYHYYNASTKDLVLMLENKGTYQVHITGIDFIYSGGGLENKTLDQTLPSGSMIMSFIVSNVTDGYQKLRISTSCPKLFKEV
jgi:flagellin-like protein